MSERFVAELEALLELYQRTYRKTRKTEASEILTGSYFHLIIAYGLARLGSRARAVAIRDTALGRLPADDAIHRYLTSAFSARIDQASLGLPLETPLPAAIRRTLPSMGKFHRYKTDRMREVSTILESVEPLDPIRAYQQGESLLGKEFDVLRAAADADAAAAEVEDLMKGAIARDPVQRAHLFNGVLTFLPGIPDHAERYLRWMTDATDEIAIHGGVVQRALRLAGYFGFREIGHALAIRLSGLFDQVTCFDAAELAVDFGRCVQAFRRLGLQAEVVDLVRTLDRAIVGVPIDKPELHHPARAGVAAGLFYIDDVDRALPSMADGHDFLGSSNRSVEDLISVNRSLGTAWGQAPDDLAVEGLRGASQHVGRFHDTYGTFAGRSWPSWSRSSSDSLRTTELCGRRWISFRTRVRSRGL